MIATSSRWVNKEPTILRFYVSQYQISQKAERRLISFEQNIVFMDSIFLSSHYL